MLAMVDLPDPDRPVNQQHKGFLALCHSALGLVHIQRLPVDVLASPQGKLDHANTGGSVGFGVNQDEGSSCAICLIGIKGNRAVERYVAGGNVVERQRVRRLPLVIVHIDPVTWLGQFCCDAPPSVFMI